MLKLTIAEMETELRWLSEVIAEAPMRQPALTSGKHPLP
jgi:hypothetical protein